MLLDDVLLLYPEGALEYENAWLEYTSTHKKPRKKADLDEYIYEAELFAEKARQKAQLKKVVEWLENYEDSCPECGWQLKPPFEDWQILKREIE